MSGEVRIRLLADVTDVDKKVGGIGNNLKNLNMNISTSQAEKSIRNVEEELNHINHIGETDNSYISKDFDGVTSKFQEAENQCSLNQIPDNSESDKHEERESEKNFKSIEGKQQKFSDQTAEIAKAFEETDNKQQKSSEDNTDSDSVSRYLQDIIQMFSLTTRILSDRQEDASNIIQAITKLNQRASTGGSQANNISQKNELHSPDVQSNIEQARAIKEEIMRLRIENKHSNNPEINQKNNSRIQTLLGQKKSIEGAISVQKSAERNLQRSNRTSSNASDSGVSSITNTLLSEVSGKIADSLFKTLSKGSLGVAGKSAAGAKAGSVAAGAGARAGIAGAGALATSSMVLPIAGVALAVATVVGKKLIKDTKEGSGQALSVEAREFQVLGKTNYYGSDMNRGRKDWYEVGKEFGYSTEESLVTAGAYMKRAGYGGMDNLKNDINSISVVSKAYGLDPSQTADVAGNLNKMGAINDGEQRKFVNMLSDAIQRNGMRGREDEQLEIMRSMADNLYTNRLTVTQEDLMNSMNLQSKMVQVNEAFKGEKGADAVSKLDNMVTGGNHTMDLLLGWGTELSGVEGYLQLQRRKELGFSDPENMERIASNFERSTGVSMQENPDYFKAYMHSNSGMNMQELDELFDNSEFVEFLKNREKSQNKLKQLSRKFDTDYLPKDIEAINNSYSGSNLSAEERRRNAKNNAKQDKGNWFNNLTRGFKNTGTAINDFFSSTGDTLFGTKATFENKSNSEHDRKNPMQERAEIGFSDFENQKLRTSNFEKTITNNHEFANSIESFKGENRFASQQEYREYQLKRKSKFEQDKNYKLDISNFERTTNVKQLSRKFDTDYIPEGIEVVQNSYNDSNLSAEKRRINAKENSKQDKENSLNNLNSNLKNKLNVEENNKSISNENRITSQQRYQDHLLEKESKLIQERAELLKEENHLLEVKMKQVEDEKDLKSKDVVLNNNPEQKKQSFFDSILGNLANRFTSSSNGIFSNGGSFGLGSSNALSGGNFGVGTSNSSGISSELGNSNATIPASKRAETAYQFDGNSSASVGTNDLSVHTKLRREHNVTAEQLNDIIEQKVVHSEKRMGRTSLLRGQGEAFIKASEATGIHPIDILTQAAHESAWGTSKIAHEKKNFFGIGAFDASPFASAYSFGQEADNAAGAGIVEGAKWIARNYVDKGQDSFHSMRWNNGVHEYATDPEYDSKMNNTRQSLYKMLPAEAINIPKLAIGHDYIPYDGYKAELHKGEAVLPKFLADKWRSGQEQNNVIDVSPIKRLLEGFSNLASPVAERSLSLENLLPLNMFNNLSSNTSTSTTSTQNVNLNISGKIQGMDKDNQNMIATAIRKHYVPATNTGLMAMLEHNSTRKQR